MTLCRWFYALGLAVFVMAPLSMPFRETLAPETWQWNENDVVRLGRLSANTLALTAGTAACSVPLGLALAVLLFRTSFLARRSLRFLLAILLFMPLPVLVSSWQGFFGPAGFLPSGLWINAAGRPWVSGRRAAIWIRTMAAVPWVTLIVGLGVTWVEPELEDEAAQCVGPWRVLMLVTLPRVRASILAAVVFVILQTAGEVSVAELMQVSTLAEETRAQFERGDGSGLARTLLLALPVLLAMWGLVGLLAWRLEKMLPPLLPRSRAQRPLGLGASWLRTAVGVVLLTVLALPLVSLLWKLDSSGHWHAPTALRLLHTNALLHGETLLKTLATAFATGAITAICALTACWLARGSRWFRWLLFGVSIWAWVMPGPVVGIGMKELILELVDLWPSGPLAVALHFAPSPLPVMWAQGLRVFPIAVVFLWPVVRMIPRELFEEAGLAGAGPISEFLHVVWPLTWRAASVTALAVTGLCLGEVAASARVETAGWKLYTSVLFSAMHYGADNTVAALSVILLGAIAAWGALVLAVFRIGDRRGVIATRTANLPALRPDARPQ